MSGLRRILWGGALSSTRYITALVTSTFINPTRRWRTPHPSCSFSSLNQGLLQADSRQHIMARTKQTARKALGTVAVPRGAPAPWMRLGTIMPPAMVEPSTPPKLPTTVPSVMRALVAQKNRASVQDHASPRGGDDDVIVKTVAVALNPNDWKRASRHVHPQSHESAHADPPF